jgi:hypothetical protein
MSRQRVSSPNRLGLSAQDSDRAPYAPTLLRVLITERHWQRFPTFERQFRRSAAALAEQQSEPDLRKATVSPRQFERWYAGKVKTEPYPDACRVLEFMFGLPVKQLFSAAEDVVLESSPAMTSAARESGRAEVDWTAGLVSVTESARLTMADALTTVARPDVEYLADGASQHAVDSIQTPPEQMLRRLVADYHRTRLLLGERQPLRQQRSLYRIVAQLSSLIADELMVLGKPLYAGSWHDMARHAADETEDDTLRAHVRTLAAILPLYYGDPSATVRLARYAQGILSGRRHAASALAPTLEALACAQLGDRGSGHLALAVARKSFETLDSRQQVESVFGFSERRWRFYESRVLSLLDDIPSAIEIQQRALALYPSEVVGDRALLQLDSARCMVRSKEISSGMGTATDVLLEMPSEHRTDIFLRYAWNVVTAVPARFRERPDVTEYCELLRRLSRNDCA